MASRTGLGKKLSMLSKATKKSQTQIADALDMPITQLNRFFNGHSELNSANLQRVLLQFDIDLEGMVSKKLRKHTDISEHSVETASDVVQFLFNELDELGRQTFLNNLAWAAKVSSNKPIPSQVQEILKKETRSI